MMQGFRHKAFLLTSTDKRERHHVFWMSILTDTFAWIIITLFFFFLLTVKSMWHAIFGLHFCCLKLESWQHWKCEIAVVGLVLLHKADLFKFAAMLLLYAPLLGSVPQFENLEVGLQLPLIRRGSKYSTTVQFWRGNTLRIVLVYTTWNFYTF